MIKGIGIDMVEIARVEESLARHGQRLIDRVATSAEKTQAPKTAGKRLAEYWAARFAAKEAFAKALGTGIGKTVPLTSVGVVKRKSGKPDLSFDTRLEQKLRRMGVSHSHLAITHTEDAATAVVILEGTKR